MSSRSRGGGMVVARRNDGPNDGRRKKPADEPDSRQGHQARGVRPPAHIRCRLALSRMRQAVRRQAGHRRGARKDPYRRARMLLA